MTATDNKATKLLIFDLDGTLVDSRADLAAAVNVARKQQGFSPLPLEQVTGMVGNGIGKLIERAFAGESDKDLGRAKQDMLDYYNEHLCVATTLYDGAVETLEALRKSGNLCAVLTNKTTSAATRLLAELKLDAVFVQIVGDGSGFPLKPAPDAVLAMCNKWQVLVENCWVIGDNYTDLEAARRSGAHAVFAEYGFGSCRTETPEFRIGALGEIPELLKRQRNNKGF